DEEIGQPWESAIHEEDRARAREAYDRAAKLRVPFAVEYRLRRFDGTYREIIDRGAPRLVGTAFEGYVGVGIDVTDRNAACRELRASEERLMLALECADLGIWDLDRESGLQRWSDNEYRVLGVPPGEPMTHERFLQQVHPDDRHLVD